MRNSNFQAGFPLTLATLCWSFEHGTIRPMAATLAAINQGVKASPIPTTSTPVGAQTFPRNSTELVQLTNNAHTSGNWSSALRLCLLRWLAVLLDYLHSKSPSDIAFLVGVTKDCLSVNIYPQWAQFTAFIDPAQYSRANDSPDSWSQHAPEVPAVAADPNMTATDEEFTNAIFIHYSHAKHYGIMSNDDGSFYMPTVSAYRFHLALAPPKVQGEKDFTSEYCLVAVKTCANYGHYPFLIVTDNLTVNSEHNLAPCQRSDVKDCREFAKHLAQCGVTPAEIETYFIWVIKYCLDIQCLTYLPARLRRQYADIFLSAQHRLMFIPINLPPGNTYVVPQSWKRDDIREYRRRCAVLRKAKENPNSPFHASDFVMPIICPATSSSLVTNLSGMAAAMNIDAAPSGSSGTSDNGSN
ncbi:hypothetical protein L218DRAFT_947938 [Marasmius fiardii PR-910]|nr:hypothetical protein L218DRAFT_947938 [Marasmius fiardii PR-910]